jgi:protein LTV1
MPRPFDKKTSEHFVLGFRAQDDARFHDSEASDRVWIEKADLNRNRKIKNLSDLESEFGEAQEQKTWREGEAANYGIYFDDSEYDYMKHLRDVGTGAGEAVFVPATRQSEGKGKSKAKGMSLDEQLRQLDLEYSNDAVSMASSRVSKAESLLPEDMLPSEFVVKRTYQDQQNVPDEIAGFQPDMDPRLREVLEALEDEEYVDDDEDMFGELAAEGEEVELDDFEASFADDDGWESDDTIKQTTKRERQSGIDGQQSSHDDEDESLDAVNDDWMKEFQKFKKDAKSQTRAKQLGAGPGDMQSSIQSSATNIDGLKRKKRKGALTASTGFSMTSSAVARTEALSVLDERFEKTLASYQDDDFNDSMSIMSGMSGFSKLSGMSNTANGNIPTTLRSDFDAIMDEFSGQYSEVGQKSRRVRKGKPQSGLEELDELRKQMGPARIAVQKTSR